MKPMANDPTSVRDLALSVLDRMRDKPWDKARTDAQNLSQRQKPAGTNNIESDQEDNPLVPLSQGLGQGQWDKPEKLGQSLGQAWDKCDCFPFARTLDALERRCPDHIEPDRWRQCINDAKHFLAAWGDQAEALGWAAAELFGLHKPPAKPHPSYCRLSRYDATGLIWHLTGNRVVALTDDTAAIQSRTTGNVTVYRKARKPALGPVGDSLDDFTA